MAARMATLALLVSSASLATALRSRGSQATEGGAFRSKVNDLETYSFRQFVKDFQRTYEEGSEQWAQREGLFNERLSKMIEFNAQPEQGWLMGLSKFMDYTEAEKKGLLGYTGRRSRRSSEVGAAATSLRRAAPLPSSFSVVRSGGSQKLMPIIRDQGSCGSCWAEAATSTLEGQLEANATLFAELTSLGNSDKKVPDTPTLASQAVVSCTANPRNCGGQGGCSGATVELAYGMLQEKGGLPFAVEWSYVGMDQDCKQDVFKNHKIGISGFTVLPGNKLNPLQEALVSSGGPIAISVDASNWFMYSEGVYSDGQGEFTVNHAVTLMGYKQPAGGEKGWWDVKNSWGSYWGENGHIRIELKENEGEHCGWDRDTHVGLACDGDPDSAWVCGTCGILYDSVYPWGLHLVKGA